MTHIEYPQGLINEARKFGVHLGNGEKIENEKDALLFLSNELNPESSVGNEDVFGGFSFKKLGRGIWKGAKSVVDNPIVNTVTPLGLIVGKGPMAELGKKYAPGYKELVGASNLVGKTVGKSIGFIPGKVNLKSSAKGIAAIAQQPAVTSFAIGKGISVKSAMAGADKLLGDNRIQNSVQIIRNTKALASLGDPAAKRGLATLNAVAKIRVARKIPPGKKSLPVKASIKIPLQAKTKQQVFALASNKIVNKESKGWWVQLLHWLEIK